MKIKIINIIVLIINNILEIPDMIIDLKVSHYLFIIKKKLFLI